MNSLPHHHDSSQDNVIRFPGFEPPEQNYSKLPHALIDALPQFKTHGELAVVLYILRHTWGFSEFDTPKRISLGEFVKGRKRRDGTRLDGGCGMSLASVKRALKAAEEHGFIVSDTNASDPGRIAKSYKLNMAHEHNEPTLVQDEPTPVQNEPTSTNTPVQNEPSYIERNLEKDTEEKELLAPAKADAQTPTLSEVDAAIYSTPEAAGNGAITPPDIATMIKAWLDASGAIDSGAYGKKGYRKIAGDLAKAGITPDQVTHFVEARRKETFWRDKTVTLSHVAQNIRAWLDSQHAPRVYAHPSHKPFDYEEPGDPGVAFEALCAQHPELQEAMNAFIENNTRDDGKVSNAA